MLICHVLLSHDGELNSQGTLYTIFSCTDEFGGNYCENMSSDCTSLLPPSEKVSKDKSENSYEPSKPPNNINLLSPKAQVLWLRIGGGYTLPGATDVGGM